jgi:hypothetical protein
MKTQFLKWYPILSLCVLAIVPVPIFLIACSFYFETEKLSLVEKRMQTLCQKQARSQAEAKKEKRFLEQLKQADRFYIDKVLKTLSFQEADLKRLKQDATTEEEKKRLLFLETANRLNFIEENSRSSEFVKEVEEKQETLIEVNEEDLKHLLVLIENVSISPYPLPEKAPQLLIKNLHLSKKQTSLYQSVFLLNMQLIKREGLFQ